MRLTIVTIVGLIVTGVSLTAYGGYGRTFSLWGVPGYYHFEEYQWKGDAVVLRDTNRLHVYVPYRFLSRSDQDFVDAQPGVVTKNEVRRGRENQPFPQPRLAPGWEFKYNWKYKGDWKYRFR